MNIKYTKKLLIECIHKSKTRNELLYNLGIKKSNSQNHLLRKIKEYDLDISHLVTVRKKSKITHNDVLFTCNSKYSRSVIRNRIIKQNLKPYICGECGQDENWRGKIMPLILDHINGINNDNRLKNLRFLCSNCDSIQPTYKNKNNRLNPEIREMKKMIINNQLKEKNNKIKEQKLENIKQQLIESKIDFSKKTWGVEVSKLLSKSPQYCLKFVKENFKELII